MKEAQDLGLGFSLTVSTSASGLITSTILLICYLVSVTTYQRVRSSLFELLFNACLGSTYIAASSSWPPVWSNSYSTITGSILRYTRNSIMYLLRCMSVTWTGLPTGWTGHESSQIDTMFLMEYLALGNMCWKLWSVWLLNCSL